MKHGGILGNGLFDEVIESKANSLATSLGFGAPFERGTDCGDLAISVRSFDGNKEVFLKAKDRLSADWYALATKHIRTWLQGIEEEIVATSKDDPATVALTPQEQAFFDLLNEEGQTGPDIIAALGRQGIGNIDESALGKMAKRPHMHARGVRHRKGAGYYKIAPPSPNADHGTPAFGF